MYQRELDRLVGQKAMLKDLERLESEVEAYCQRLREGLSTFDFEEKRKALNALQVKVMVTETDLRVKGILGVADSASDFSSTARIWGCMFRDSLASLTFPMTCVPFERPLPLVSAKST